MLSLKNILITLSITIFITVANSLILVTSAEAMTQSFQWTGTTGYSAQGKFSYDEGQVSTTISEQGAGKTHTLQSLSVTFYSPSGEPISTYENIVDGMARGNYFELHFDPVKQKLLGSIDLGGEFVNEMYLKGEVDRELSLIEVEQSGLDRTLDKDSGSIKTQSKSIDLLQKS